MAVAGNADPMLGYLTTSFREHPRLRAAASGADRRSPMQQRLTALGVTGRWRAAALGRSRRAPLRRLRQGRRRSPHGVVARGRGAASCTNCASAASTSASPSRRTRTRGSRRSTRTPAPRCMRRVDEGVIRDATSHARARADERRRAATTIWRIRRPASGCATRTPARSPALYPARRPQVQFVVSDGLNANAINEQLAPAAAAAAPAAGRPADTRRRRRHRRAERTRPRGLRDRRSRRRRRRRSHHRRAARDGAQHRIGVSHLRAGRGGRTRWGRSLDHSATTAICGIHPKGKPPQAAAEEIARTVQRMIDQRRSGVALQASP